MKNSDIEFYSQLGLLSTKFAVMEYYLFCILGELIAKDEIIITGTILENNSLAKNLELLAQINKIRNYENTAIKNLITKINGVKGIRNSFIHGLWEEPYEFENDLMITCVEPKIQYIESKEKGKVISRGWSNMKTREFRLTYIKKQIEIINDIITAQEFFIRKLENHDFD